ncbi:MAG: PorV/PorQ family protein [Ignavibacteria bacterium]
MKKILFLIIVCSTFVNAQSAGSTGLSFLKFGFGAKNIAMGDAGAANANDVSALYYNPAFIALYSSPEIMFSHNQLVQDVRSEMLGVSFGLFGLPLALGINTTNIPDIEIRTQPGEAQAKFNVNYFSGSLSTGFYILKNISVGATVKYLYENILVDEANGPGFDIGVLYQSSDIEGLNFGVVVRNIGSMNKLRMEATKLPTDISAGASYGFDLLRYNSLINLAAEFQKYTSTGESHLKLGAEAVYDDMISLRAGYQQGFQNKGICAGLGLNYYNLNFDYAMTPYSLDFGTSHTISIKFKF